MQLNTRFKSDQQGLSPWRCWRTWSLVRFTWWKFLHPTTWVMGRSLTLWSWQCFQISPPTLGNPQVSAVNTVLIESFDIYRWETIQGPFWIWNMVIMMYTLYTDCVSSSFAGFSDGFYHLDQKSMTGITVGVCIALICIIICAFILVCRGKNRYLPLCGHNKRKKPVSWSSFSP